MKIPFWIGMLSALLAVVSCVPPDGPERMQVRISPEDPVVQQIWTYQNRQQLDSLLHFFGHKQATYRYLAAIALASYQPPEAGDSLIYLLADPVDSVRMAAAYALGQLRDTAYAAPLAEAFDQLDTTGRYRWANAAILEAIGKCAPARYLDFLAGITSYLPTDTVLNEGLARGIYRFGLRGIHGRAGTRRMVDGVLDDRQAPAVRRMAAFYLSRIPDSLRNLDDPALLVRAYTTEQDVWTRWALAVAVAKTGTEEAFQALSAQYALEKDDRLRGEVMKALVHFPYARAKPLALKGLQDASPMVVHLAAQFFLEAGEGRDVATLTRWARSDSLPWPARLTMARAAMRHYPTYATAGRRAYSYKLRFNFLKAQDPYEKAAWLAAIAEEGWNYRFIRREGFGDPHPAVRTASVAALRSIASRPDFDSYFGLSARGRTAELADYFVEAIGSGDAGMIGEAAAALRTPERQFGDFLDSLAFLRQALDALPMPQGLEARRELQHTLAYLQGRPFAPAPPAGVRPITWGEWSDEPLQAQLHTQRGTIELELWPQCAPATVSAVVDLARQGYYDGKVLHRIVPNFVVQGGCPRGDGYGGPQFVLRSELPPLYYDEGGLLGMASAGRHTEGSQFFITHVPTPHLDGRYTLFGRVQAGSAVLSQLMPGDTIVQFTFSQ